MARKLCSLLSDMQNTIGLNNVISVYKIMQIEKVTLQIVASEYFHIVDDKIRAIATKSYVISAGLTASSILTNLTIASVLVKRTRTTLCLILNNVCNTKFLLGLQAELSLSTFASIDGEI